MDFVIDHSFPNHTYKLELLVYEDQLVIRVTHSKGSQSIWLDKEELESLKQFLNKLTLDS